MKYFGTTAQDPYILLSKNPVNSFEDVKGMNIITLGRFKSDLVSEWGATAVSIQHNEVYEALQRGTADAIFYSGASSVTGLNYYEVAPHFVPNLSLNAATLIVLMNKEKYESLPDDLKETFDELALELSNMMTQSYQNEYESFTKILEDMEGTTVTELSEDEFTKFAEYANVSVDQWVEAANEKGYPGEEMLDYLIELFEEEGVNVDYLK